MPGLDSQFKLVIPASHQFEAWEIAVMAQVVKVVSLLWGTWMALAPLAALLHPQPVLMGTGK